jgi:hypothetical protein
VTQPPAHRTSHPDAAPVVTQPPPSPQHARQAPGPEKRAQRVSAEYSISPVRQPKRAVGGVIHRPTRSNSLHPASEASNQRKGPRPSRLPTCTGRRALYFWPSLTRLRTWVESGIWRGEAERRRVSEGLCGGRRENSILPASSRIQPGGPSLCTPRRSNLRTPRPRGWVKERTRGSLPGGPLIRGMCVLEA